MTFHLVHHLVSSNQIVVWEVHRSYSAEVTFALIPLEEKEKEKEEEGEEGEDEHRLFLTYTWSVRGEIYKSKTLNTSLKIGKDVCLSVYLFVYACLSLSH